MAESPQVNHAAQPLDHKTAGDVSYAAHLSVAPMMDWTDRHCRYFHRLMSKQALLYTEMVTAPAVIHGDRARLLDFRAAEHPLAIQLGGSNPAKLAQACDDHDCAAFHSD